MARGAPVDSRIDLFAEVVIIVTDDFAQILLELDPVQAVECLQAVDVFQLVFVSQDLEKV